MGAEVVCPQMRVGLPRQVKTWGVPILLVFVLVVPIGPHGTARPLAAPRDMPCSLASRTGCPAGVPSPRAAPASTTFAGNWTELFPSSPPSARTQPAIAYDPTIQSVVLFGGYSPFSGALSDTWVFANNTWTQLSSNLSVAPSARWGASMVWDETDGYLLLFGGRYYYGYYNDTWTFNGTAWSLLSPPTAPPTRSLFEMAYDPVDRAVIVDGGARYSFTYGTWASVNDTWAFSGGVWTNISATAPGGALDRAAGQSVFDPWNGSVVFVGGGSTANWSSSGCTPNDPVQTYVNGSWYEYPLSVGPPQISQEMLTYDSDAKLLLLFGGFAPSGSSTNCIQLNATWIRSNGVWSNVSGSLPVAPSIRYLSGIAFDPTLDEVLLFGGNGQGAYLGDTWIFRIPSLDTLIHASRSFGIAPMTVSLVADTVGGATVSGYNWSFGDGATSSLGPSVNHTFGTPGIYHVTVNVTGPLNDSFVANLTIVVAPPLRVAASASVDVGSLPLRVDFYGNSSGGFAPYRFNWSFGDGSHASLANVTHTYAT
jgi:hypothetical protein